MLGWAKLRTFLMSGQEPARELESQVLVVIYSSIQTAIHESSYCWPDTWIDHRTARNLRTSQTPDIWLNLRTTRLIIVQHFGFARFWAHNFIGRHRPLTVSLYNLYLHDQVHSGTNMYLGFSIMEFICDWPNLRTTIFVQPMWRGEPGVVRV